MSNLTVAVIGPESYAAELGKKGTSSDITFYNLKRGPYTVTLSAALAAAVSTIASNAALWNVLAIPCLRFAG